jgi:hypothetical protein
MCLFCPHAHRFEWEVWLGGGGQDGLQGGEGEQGFSEPMWVVVLYAPTL